MPPNRKIRFLDLSDLDQLVEINTTIRSIATDPTPPLLTADDNDGADFFLRDIEENAPPPQQQEEEPQPQHQHQHQRQQTEEEEKISKDRQHTHNIHRRVIRHLASKVGEPKELSTDEQRLAQAVRDAGEYSSGVIACEVWMLQEEDHQLVRPNGGWWYNTKLMPELQHHYQDETPPPVPPGVDVPGILWSEMDREHLDSLSGGTTTPPPQPPRRASGGMLAPEEEDHHDKKHSIFGQSIDGLVHLYQHQPHHQDHHDHHSLVWRDLYSIAQDPDSAKTERFGDLLEHGLGAAAGVPFHVRHHRGIVIYYARNHHHSNKRQHLSKVANDAYLRASADLIGHAAALSETRRASVESKRRHNRVVAQVFQRNLLLENSKRKDSTDASNQRLVYPEQATHLGSRSSDDKVLESTIWSDGSDTEDDIQEPSWTEVTLHRFQIWCHKFRGANLQIPPAMSLRQTLWTIFGSFCGLLVLSTLNEYYMMLSDDEYFLLMGPFGALMTLQYGLTSAPASQPRNAVLGQAVCGAVSLAFTYIPDWILATWLRRAVGPAFGIGAMVKLGLTHPPAGAHAVIYASGDYGFGFYALVVFSSAIAVIPATIVNNMSLKRKYPNYWTLVEIPDGMRAWLGCKKEEDDKL